MMTSSKEKVTVVLWEVEEIKVNSFFISDCSVTNASIVFYCVK